MPLRLLRKLVRYGIWYSGIACITERAIEGYLAFVQNGDMIELDVALRKLHLHVSD